MHGYAHENRFVKYNDTNIVNSKFAKYQSPAFEKWAVHSLDEFIRNPSNCKDENANHQAYYPEYTQVEKDLSVGLPDFRRFISKEQRRTKLPFEKTPNPYDNVKVQEGYNRSRPKRTEDKDIVPFKLLMGRDNLYERMNGLPKYTKEQMN